MLASSALTSRRVVCVYASVLASGLLALATSHRRRTLSVYLHYYRGCGVLVLLSISTLTDRLHDSVINVV